MFKFRTFVSMQELKKYINELLYLHDCVILPGFGGFVANYKSAQIDEASNSFVPPSKNISFNRNLVQNDGLLINKLVDKMGVSYIDAEKTVNFFAEDLNVKIQRGDKVNFVGLGDFYRDSQYNLQFEPNLTSNFLVDSFGLRSFSFSPVLEKRISLDNNSVVRTSFFNKKLFLCAAVGIPVLFLSGYYFFNNVRHLNYNNHEVRASLELVSDSGTASQKKNIKKSPSKVSSKSPSNDLVAFTPQLDNYKSNFSVASEGKFYLIAGSFSDMNNAEILKSELLKKSYPAFIFLHKKLYCVAFSKFDSQIEASDFKLTVLTDNPKANTWIMKK